MAMDNVIKRVILEALKRADLSVYRTFDRLYYNIVYPALEAYGDENHLLHSTYFPSCQSVIYFFNHCDNIQVRYNQWSNVNSYLYVENIPLNTLLPIVTNEPIAPTPKKKTKYKITHFRKEGTKICFYDTKNNLVGSYDFVTKQTTLPARSNLIFHKGGSMPNDYIETVINLVWADNFPEWVLSYPDLINCYSFKTHNMYGNLPLTCPKGYINYCKEKNKTISPASLYHFNVETKVIKSLSFLPEKQREKAFAYFDRICDYSELEICVENNLFKDLLTMRINSYKDFEPRVENHISEIIDLIKQNEEKVKGFQFDTNRGIEYNMNLLRAYVKREENEKIAKQQKKLLFLNKYIPDTEHIVIVPETVADLQEEGRQQNNCVGHYYNRSIAQGENLILFIRKCNSPDNSYVTCRYNVEQGELVECRLKNNASAYSSELLALFEKIGAMIRNNL